MIAANYFDGHDGRLHWVDLSVSQDGIEVIGESFTRSFRFKSVQLGETFADAPCVLDFADGSRCEVHAPAAKQAFLNAFGYRKSLVVKWQEHWPGALLAIMIMLLGLFAANYWGVPLAADRIAGYIPFELEKSLGDEALAGLDQQLFEPTGLSDQRMQQAQDIFRKIAPSNPRMPLKLVFRAAKLAGPNAFALPNGTIVLTDAMVHHIAGDGRQGGDLIGDRAHRLAGVLAHEIGHVQAGHGLRKLVAASLFGVLSWGLFGDFSAVAAGAPTLMLQLQYSRAMEAEADGYAADLLRQHGIAPKHLADLFESVEAGLKPNPQATLPSWMRKATDYLSTHPASEERIARLRQI